MTEPKLRKPVKAKRWPRGKYPRRSLARIRAISQVTGKVGYVLVGLYTAAAFAALRSRVFKDKGVWLYASGPVGGYRSLRIERWMRTHFRWLWPILAPVGQSNHNEADCIDLYNWRAVSSAYLNRVLPLYGFSRPIKSEGWHLQHNRSSKWRDIQKAKAKAV